MGITYQNYLSILILFIISIIFAALPLASNFLVSYLINNKHFKKLGINLNNAAQRSPYECGAKHFSDARFRFPIKFALIAILFIIFDVELVFLLPWSIIFSKLPVSSTITVGIFLLILAVIFIYEWKKGAMDWD